MKKWVALILACALCVAAVPAMTMSAEGAEPIRILAIGNSYSNNATQYTEFILESMNTDVEVEVYSLYYAGCSLAQHVNFYTNQSQVYELFRKGSNVNGTNVKVTMQDVFALYDYDYITVQQAPGRASTFSTYWSEANPYLTQLQDIIEANEPQAQIKVHQTWSFNHYCAIGNDPYYKDRSWENTKLMFADIEDSYEQAAAKLGLTNDDIIPVGRAVQLAKDQFGYGDFYNTGATSAVAQCANGALYADNISHLNNRARYLAACVWLEYFFGADCRTATYVPTMLTESDCKVLHMIAHETVTGDQTDSVVGNWRVLDNGDGVKLMHYMGTVPENGAIAIPATVGDKAVNAVAATAFKYVDGVKSITVPAGAEENWDIEEGAFPVALTDVAAGTVTGSGTLTFSCGQTENASSLVNVEEGAIVTVTATPADGYLLVPGSVTYTTAGGVTVNVLNKTLDGSGFGEGDGYSYQFVMPAEQVTVNAEFSAVGDTSFLFDTVGVSVHETEGVYDGIRFLTRINFGAFDQSEDAITVTYGGKTYTVSKIGMLLKRADNATALTVENAKTNTTGVTKIWNAVAYDKAVSDTLRVVDYTTSYLDVQTVMMKSDSTSTRVFRSRGFTACGYLVLSDATGAETVVYTKTSLTKAIKDIVASGPLKPEFGEVELS